MVTTEHDPFLPDDPANLLVADPTRREPVSFDASGNRLAGHLYRPPEVRPGTRTGGIVMCGPISSVKEQTLPHYAERFADAGYTVLTFDPSHFGESEGEPRFHYDPWQVISDYVDATAYLMNRDDIDPARVAVVGVCMGGGYALAVAARERRVAACASVAGGYDIGGTFRQMMGADGFAAYLRLVNEARDRERRTGETVYIPTIAQGLTDDEPLAVMPVAEAYSYYARTSAADAPNWSWKMTAASLEPYLTFNAISQAPLVAPTPLLIVHGTTDSALLPEKAQAAFDAASEPKELVWIETHNHIELYDQDPYVSEAVGHVLRWLDGLGLGVGGR
ncbi:MAG TPA: alpha/beta hydrolase [Solirubrobacterales bacterium]